MVSVYQKLTKKFTRTFYYSTLFFPKKIRDQVFLLYAFVRIIDNLVDMKKPNKKKFFLLKKNLEAFLKEERKSSIRIVNDIGHLIKEKNLEHEMRLYLKTQEKELTKKRYLTFREFSQFTNGVAGTIGVMMAKLFGLPKTVYPEAKNLGISLQIINNIRDLYEDYRRQKIYLPADLLKKHHLTQKNFLKEEKRNCLKKLVTALLEKSFRLEREARKGYLVLEKNILFPIKVAVSLYQQIGKKIATNPNLIFKKNQFKPTFFQIAKTIVEVFFSVYVLNRKT